MTDVERSFGHDAAAPDVAGLASGALAVVAATFLLELSRTLAERARGRWYAGNGRDVFHAGAAGVMAGALFLNGLPAALAFAVAGTASMVPLMVLDWIHEQRKRVTVLLAAVGAGMLPALAAPQLTVEVGNALARALFPRGG
jgi:hypothetical protein